jgi:hypothetical protein
LSGLGGTKQNEKFPVSSYIFLWDMGLSTNSEIDELLEISYSWVSRRAETTKVRIDEDRAITGQVENLKSQIKM